jgi:hypothetical protein
MTTTSRGAGAFVLAVSLSLAGCSSFRYARMPAPEGDRALGLEFGADRAETERALAAERIAARAAPDDADALLADRCPVTPVRAPCRLLFGPQGLYAAQVEVPARDAGALASSVEKGLGVPDRAAPEQTAAAEGLSTVVAGWERPGWTISVSTTAAAVQPALGVLRVEYDRAAPPVVAGVPLGRLRDDVEHVLDHQGATVVQRDAGSTTFLGCPHGAGDAMSCVVLFRARRAAAVTEVHPAPADDKGALAAWRLLVKRFEKDIGRAPVTACPDDGPDRVEGDCTATWASDRLVVVVGAHRNAGASHRGAISVYTQFTYPPLASAPGEDVAEGAVEAQ